ncbi:MAG: Macrolide export ATP-binding/permease protein MacB [Ktedonobacterales bacterium]|jgi:3-methyladenine DNA glycosylase AlkC|nr:MAG: Macrolide export ATP-binding/permease protein MacB [Ktedonobacterales bacterium]
MSHFDISLRLIGELDVLENAAHAMEGLPFELRRRGERYRRRRVQPANVLLLQLAKWERGALYSFDDRETIFAEEDRQLANATTVLQQLAPMLANLDRSQCDRQLYISTIREEEDGGLTLPEELVAAAGDAGLSINVSILVLMPDDDDDDDDQDAEGEGQRMQPIPSLDGLNWSQVRTLARELAASELRDDVVAAALPLLDAAEAKRRMLAVYLLGFTSDARPGNLDILLERVVPDPDWEVQEALAQAFNAYCTAVDYETALPVIDGWLADAHPNARRAVSEGLRPWTAKSRTYFARHPEAAISRLAALRRDTSEYVRHSAGNALRDIRRSYPALVDAETATWNLDDARERFTYERVLKAK